MRKGVLVGAALIALAGCGGGTSGDPVPTVTSTPSIHATATSPVTPTSVATVVPMATNSPRPASPVPATATPTPSATARQTVNFCLVKEYDSPLCPMGEDLFSCTDQSTRCCLVQEPDPNVCFGTGGSWCHPVGTIPEPTPSPTPLCQCERDSPRCGAGHSLRTCPDGSERCCLGRKDCPCGGFCIVASPSPDSAR